MLLNLFIFFFKLLIAKLGIEPKTLAYETK